MKNNGTKDITNVTVKLTDTLGTETETTLNVNLASGAETSENIKYVVPENYGPATLTVQATISPVTNETNTANNVASEKIGYADIRMSDIVVSNAGDTYMLSATLTNDNQIPAENVSVDILENDKDGMILDTAVIGTMLPGESYAIEYVVFDRMMLNTDDDGVAKICFNASTASNELLTEDNCSTTVISLIPNDNEYLTMYHELQTKLDELKEYNIETLDDETATAVTNAINNGEAVLNEGVPTIDLIVGAIEEICSIHFHTYGNWIVTKEPTCTTAGSRYKECACGDKIVEVIEALGHEYLTTFTVDVPATCTQEGSKSRHCIRCDAKTEVTAIPMENHSYGDWVVTKEPTQTEEGVETRRCENCDETETRAIPVIDPTPSKVSGDVNGDGKLSTVDAKWILQNLASIREFTDEQKAFADVNHDGKISIVDAKWILQALAGMRELS